MQYQKLTDEQKKFMLFAALQAVPSGRVISYGTLARLAGLGNAARWVGHILSKLPADSQLPWHRVIAASGKISLPEASQSGILQRSRLQNEGIQVHHQRINYARYAWKGG